MPDIFRKVGHDTVEIARLKRCLHRFRGLHISQLLPLLYPSSLSLRHATAL